VFGRLVWRLIACIGMSKFVDAIKCVCRGL
jgi:hypothetical protein